MDHCETLVVGAGISGLVCTYQLKRLGVEAWLVESSHRAGGVIHSVVSEGFLVERGPQSFSGNAALRELCADLGISNELLQAPPRAPRYILVEGKLRPVPLSPPAFFSSSLIDASAKWGLLRDLFGKGMPPQEDESVAQFVRRKFSDQLLDRLVGPFISGIYAGDPEKLSFRGAFPRIHEAEKATGSIVRGMIRLARAQKGPRERPTLQTFRQGNETLVRSLSAKLGTALKTETQIASLAKRAATGFDVTLDSHGEKTVIAAESLVFATPTQAAGKLLGAIDPLFEAALKPVEYAPVAVASLGYKLSDVGRSLQGFGFLVPRSTGVRVLGTVWNSSLFPGRAPEGKALLTSFVGGSTDPEATKLTLAEIAGLVHREIQPIMDIRGEPVFSSVTVLPRALPQYNLGHGQHLAQLEKLRLRFPRVWLTGNYFRGPAIGACTEQAIAIAREVAKS